MVTRMLPSHLPADRAGGPNLITWQPSSMPGRASMRLRHRPTHTDLTFDGPPASSGDSGLHSPLETPDPLTRLYQGTLEFRIRPVRTLDGIARPTHHLLFRVVVGGDSLEAGSYSAALRWRLDARDDDFGDIESRTGDADRRWKPGGRLRPDVQWHEFQYSLDPSRQSAWISVDGRPVDTGLVRSPSATDGTSRLGVECSPVGELDAYSPGGFSFRNWETTAHEHRRWDGG